MNVSVSRSILVVIAVVFSAHHATLGVLAAVAAPSPLVIVLALVLYVVATALSLLPYRSRRLPLAVASFTLGVSVIVPVLVSSQLDPDNVGPYSAWYAAAIGTLMVITSTRHRRSFAWAGVGYLALQTVLWGGVASLATVGVIGSIAWVAISHLLSIGVAQAAKDTVRFAQAEREATEWQAAQEAHVFERQARLAQTSALALPMLQRIIEQRGNLSDSDRVECLHLEGAIRDEIRGRQLLDDDVRAEVRRARKRGATVSLLDEGGLDGLPAATLADVRARVAAAIAASRADSIIARTSGEPSARSVTVVGLLEGDGDDIESWLEIKL